MLEPVEEENKSSVVVGHGLCAQSDTRMIWPYRKLQITLCCISIKLLVGVIMGHYRFERIGYAE